ncbi:MAG: nitrogenase, partial [Methanoculleus thermophilus]
ATRIHALRGDPHPWSAQSGYTGAVAYGNFLLQALKSRSFQKTLKEKTKDSYRDWWFKQSNPLYYMKRVV